MADEYQVVYEYTDGNTVSFKTDNLKVSYQRHGMRISRRPDGKMYVDDPGVEYRIFQFSAVISGATMDTLDGVQMAAITYSGGYPRIQKIYWNGATTETNIEIAIVQLSTTDMGNGWWMVECTMEEKTD